LILFRTEARRVQERYPHEFTERNPKKGHLSFANIDPLVSNLASRDRTGFDAAVKA
jgi:hypothetical protein